MKRFGVLTIAALCLGVAGSAVAQEGTAPDWANKSGAVGVGGNTTLAGSNGINIRTYVTPQLGLELTFGFQIRSLSNDEADTSASSTAFEVGISGSYKLAYWQRGHLSAFLGLDIQTLSTSTEAGGTETDASATDILISIGIMGEYFPTQYLSLFMRAGLLLDFLGEDETGALDGPLGEDDSGFELSLISQVEGLAGFTVWFK